MLESYLHLSGASPEEGFQLSNFIYKPVFIIFLKKK